MRGSSRNDGTAEARKQASAGCLVLEQILVGADGKLFCMIRAPGSERRLVKRGEAVVFPGGSSPGTGYRIEAIVPDGRGGGRVVLSRNEGKETLELTLEAGSSGGRRRREPTPPNRPLRLRRPDRGSSSGG